MEPTATPSQAVSDTVRKPFGGRRFTGSKKGRKRASELLRDLRHVYRNPPELDQSLGQKALRKLFDANPGKFLDRLQRAETAHRATNGKLQGTKPQERTASPAPEPVDEGEEKCLKLLEELLKSRGWEK